MRVFQCHALDIKKGDRLDLACSPLQAATLSHASFELLSGGPHKGATRCCTEESW